MGTGYTRQAAADLLPGDDIEAGPLNAEFNQVQSAFDGTIGHAHDGSVGNGPKILGSNLTVGTSFNPNTDDGASLGTLTGPLRWSDLFLAPGAVVNWASGDYALTHSTGVMTLNTANTGSLIFTSTDSGAAVGPVIELFRDSSTPVQNDVVGRLLFTGRSSGNTKTNYAALTTTKTDPTGDSTKLTLSLQTSGSFVNFFAFNTQSATQGNFSPGISGAVNLGDPSGNAWGNLYLNTSGTISFKSGVSLTYSSNLLTFAGASAGYTFDTELFPTANDGAALGDTTHNWSDLFLATGGVINWNAGNLTLTQSAGILALAGSGGALLDLSSATAGQIKFPSTQNASANANTLDDYAEGTWTPNLQFGGANVGITYTSQTARSTKIGRLVMIEGQITLSSKGSSTGAATISNVPFTVGANVACSVTPIGATFSGLTAGLTGNLVGGGTAMSIRTPITTGTVTAADTNFTNTSSFMFSALYSV